MAVVEDVRQVRSVGVEDVLRAGGFTRFHRKAVLVTGAAWTFVAMEILLVGFTVPLFTTIWGLSGSYAGWIAASALGGSLLGSLVLGPAADRVGRRRIFQAAILWYAVFTALTAFAWDEFHGSNRIAVSCASCRGHWINALRLQHVSGVRQA